MQKIYKTIFNLTYRITGRIDEKVRNAILFLCFFSLISIYFFVKRRVDNKPGDIMIIGSLIVCAMTVFSNKGNNDHVRWNRALYIPFILFGIGIFLVGNLHSVGDGFVMLSIDMALIYPAFYYIWGNRKDSHTLYKIMSYAIITAGIINFVYCLYLACNGNLNISHERVAGNRSNPNLLAMLGVMMLIASIYLILEWTGKKKRVILVSVTFGAGLSYIIISASRTAMLVAAGCFAVMIIFAVKRVKKYDVKFSQLRTIVTLIILICGLAIMCGIKMVDINNRVLADSNEMESTQIIEDEERTIIDRMDASGGVDSFSSGRTRIWRIYISNASLLGKPFSEIEDQLQGSAAIRAHNNFCEYFYRCGYIVGMAYVIFFIVIAAKGLGMLFKSRYTSAEDAFIVMMIGAYSTYSMLEISMLPFMRIIPCIFFLSISPVMIKNDETTERGI